MRKSVFWGILLITAGVLWWLKISHAIDFTFRDLLSLWPLILLWLGIGWLPIKDGYKIGLDVATLALGLWLLCAPPHWANETLHITENPEPRTTATFHTYKNQEKVSLRLEAGAAAIAFRADPSTLIRVHGANLEGVRLDVDENSGEEMVDIDLEITGLKWGTHSRPYKIYLHPQPVWKLSCELGATDNTLDLSSLKVSSLSLASGASHGNLKIGDLYPEVDVNLDMGVSSLSIAIPETMDCFIEDESLISDIDFPGFTKDPDGILRSQVADSLRQGVIRIHCEAGASKISVRRYGTEELP